MSERPNKHLHLIRHTARIRALDDGWLSAAACRDLDGMMAIYAPDAQVLLPGHPALVGRDTIRAFYRDLLARLPRFAHHFEPRETTVAESGDLAVVRGTYHFTPDTLIPDQMHQGKCLEVWRLLGNDWRLHTTFRMPTRFTCASLQALLANIIKPEFLKRP